MNVALNALSALDAVGDGVICTDSELEVNFINKKACSILGKEASNVIGCGLEAIMTIQTDEGTFVKDVAIEVLKTGVSQGLRTNSYIVTDRMKLYLSASISKIEGCDEDGLVINFRDITKLKQYEFDYLMEKHKFESLFRTMPMGVIVIDRLKKVQYNNPFISKQFGVDTQKDVNLMIGNLLSCENAEGRLCGTSTYCKNCILSKNFSRINKGDSYHRSMKIEFSHSFAGVKTKRNYQVEFATVDEDDNSDIMVIIQDITKQMVYEENLKKARIEAQEANKLKSQFLANMSHEIRTPLNGIIGMIDLTRRMVDDEELIDNLVTAKTSSEGLLRIINDVLDYSKLEAGKMTFRNAQYDLEELAKEVINENKFEAKMKGLVLSYEWDEAITNTVNGDKARLKQVLNNLITNSIKFTDQGSIILAFKKVIEAEEALDLEIHVTDTGIGIEESQREMLFNSFTQVDGSYTRKRGGTGLGLAISKEIVEKMNGSITFFSTVGEGTDFVIELPLDKSEIWPETTIIHNSEDEGKAIAGKILLVEDDLINQMVIRKKLEMEGYTVDVASDGQSGIDYFKASEYALVIMDIQMPVMSGLQAVDHIRKLERGMTTAVIALTALALKQDQQSIMSHGFDIYITKPIDLEYLSKLVKKFVEDQPNYRYKEVTQDIVAYSEPQFFDESELVTHMNSIKISAAQSSKEDLEEQCVKLKEYFELHHMAEYRTIAFKMSMEARKEKYDKVLELLEAMTWQLEARG